MHAVPRACMPSSSAEAGFPVCISSASKTADACSELYVICEDFAMRREHLCKVFEQRCGHKSEERD